MNLSIISCLIGAYAFPAPPRDTLKDYYRKVRPFGLWGPILAMLREEGEDPRRPARDRLARLSRLVRRDSLRCVVAKAGGRIVPDAWRVSAHRGGMS